jgi:hypothetical protein
MAPIANALRLIYRVMSAKKQVGKSLEFANPLLKVLYVLIVDITCSVFKILSCASTEGHCRVIESQICADHQEILRRGNYILVRMWPDPEARCDIEPEVYTTLPRLLK